MCIRLGSDAGRNFLSSEDPVKKEHDRFSEPAPEPRVTFLRQLLKRLQASGETRQ
jgi:hypothetical protein